jgi:MFS family permease
MALTAIPADGLSKKVRVLEERNLQWYFGTQLFSLTGLMLRQSILSLLIIDLVGVKNAPPFIGMVWALNVLPGAFLGVFAGIFLDVYDKRRILQITAILGLIQGLMLAYLCFRDVHHIAMWQIMSIMLFTGLTNAVDGIGRNVIVKEAVVHKYNTAAAAIIFNSLYTIGMIAGNGISGYLVLSIGYGWSFVLNALSFVILLFGLSKMDFGHVPRLEKPRFRGIWETVKSGFVYAFTDPTIRISILLAAFITIFGFAYNVIMSVIAKEMFAGGPKEYSYLAAISGLGCLAGSAFAIIWGTRKPKASIVYGCYLLGLGQIIFARSTNIQTGAILLFLCGFGFMCAFLPLRGLLMHHVDGPRTGIVFGILFMFFYGGMMLSSLGSGYIAKHFGCPAVLDLCGIVIFTTAILLPILPGYEYIK